METKEDGRCKACDNSAWSRVDLLARSQRSDSQFDWTKLNAPLLGGRGDRSLQRAALLLNTKPDSISGHKKEEPRHGGYQRPQKCEFN